MKILFILLVIFSAQSQAGNGWTGYGKITELNQQPGTGADVVIVANLPNNPTTCTVKSNFLLDVSTDRDKRTFSLLLSAFMAGKEVRLYVTDECPVWDTPKVTGVYIK